MSKGVTREVVTASVPFNLIIVAVALLIPFGLWLNVWVSSAFGVLVAAWLLLHVRMTVEASAGAGLRVTSWTGIPLRRLSGDRVRRVSFGDSRIEMGGERIGINWKGGRTSILTRSGAVTIVERTDGRKVIISRGTPLDD